VFAGRPEHEDLSPPPQRWSWSPTNVKPPKREYSPDGFNLDYYWLAIRRERCVLVCNVFRTGCFFAPSAISLVVFNRRAQVKSIEFILHDRFYGFGAPSRMSLHRVKVKPVW
jgi:hypothetical protein